MLVPKPSALQVPQSGVPLTHPASRLTQSAHAVFSETFTSVFSSHSSFQLQSPQSQNLLKHLSQYFGLINPPLCPKRVLQSSTKLVLSISTFPFWAQYSLANISSHTNCIPMLSFGLSCLTFPVSLFPKSSCFLSCLLHFLWIHFRQFLTVPNASFFLSLQH